MLFEPLQPVEAVPFMIGLFILAGLLLVTTAWQFHRKRLKPATAWSLMAATCLVLTNVLAWNGTQPVADLLAPVLEPLTWVMGLAILALFVPVKRGPLPRPVRFLAVSLVGSFAIGLSVSASRWVEAAKPLTAAEAKELAYERLHGYCGNEHDHDDSYRIAMFTADKDGSMVTFRNKEASPREITVIVTRFRTTEISLGD